MAVSQSHYKIQIILQHELEILDQAIDKMLGNKVEVSIGHIGKLKTV